MVVPDDYEEDEEDENEEGQYVLYYVWVRKDKAVEVNRVINTLDGVIETDRRDSGYL